MQLRSPWLAALACLSLAAGGAGLQACSSSSSSGGIGWQSDAGGADGSHGGHDASGGGADATSGDDASSDDGGGSVGDDATTGGDTGAADTGAKKDGGGKDAGGDAADGGKGGGDAASDGGSGADAAGDAGDLDAGEGGAAEDCGSSPTLHVDDAGSVFCGFGADGGHLYCGTGQECCLGGPTDLEAGTFAPQECAAFGSACTNPADGGLPIQCGQIADCTANGQAGNVCCLQGATVPTIVAGCGYARASHGTGIVCEAPAAGSNACAAGETQICSQDLDCPTGKVCTPMKWKVFQLGFCM